MRTDISRPGGSRTAGLGKSVASVEKPDSRAVDWASLCMFGCTSSSELNCNWSAESRKCGQVSAAPIPPIRHSVNTNTLLPSIQSEPI